MPAAIQAKRLHQASPPGFAGLFGWLLCALLLAPATLQADSWVTQLGDGDTISVDPATNRATVRSGEGSGQPLWDGVHRLQDGSTITIRSGVMVPNEQLRAPGNTPLPLRPGDDGPSRSMRKRDPTCDLLVLKACGLRGECARQESCHLARQLRTLQNRAVRDPQGREWALEQCRQADNDTHNFPACPQAVSPCQQLVGMLCVDRERCADSAACRTALQLQQLEWQTYFGDSPGASLEPSRQCQEMLLEHAFFAPCR